MGMADAERFHPDSLADWHEWLAAHAHCGAGVWVVLWRPRSGHPALSYDELIREALCWGWIDGQSKPLDDDRSMLWMTRRTANSPWSASNKARVAELEQQGRLQPAGREVIRQAKANGNWTILDSVDALIEPPDLGAALEANPLAKATWSAYPPSVKRMVLAQLAFAKRDDTRARRITKFVAAAARGERPA
jgi:uncharacterized protein YdeI (YjbR/CyaY-like superfamily)